MSIAFVQAQHQLSPDLPGPINSVGVAYESANTAGNIGFAAVFGRVGEGPIQVTDSFNNSWCPYTGAQSNNGFGQLFVCLNLKAAPALANIVTASGVMTSDENGGPLIVIAEFSAPANCIVLAFQPNAGDLDSPPSAQIDVGYTTVLHASGAASTCMSIMFVYDVGTYSPPHSWQQFSGTQISLDSIFQETDGMCGCMAYTDPVRTGNTLDNTVVIASDITETTLQIFVTLGVSILEIA